MTTTFVTEEQKMYTGHGHEVVVPVDWNAIAAPARGIGIVTGQRVRQILNQLVISINQHFCMMDGPYINRVAVTPKTRWSRPEDGVLIHMALSIALWPPQSGFALAGVRPIKAPVYVYLYYLVKVLTEKGSAMQLSMPTKTLRTNMRASRQIPCLRGWRAFLATRQTRARLTFGAYNARKRIVEDVHAQMEEASGDSILEWHPKRIWQEYYRLLPGTRPAKGYRTRRRGQDVIYVPRRDVIESRLSDIRASARTTFRFWSGSTHIVPKKFGIWLAPLHPGCEEWAVGHDTGPYWKAITSARVQGCKSNAKLLMGTSRPALGQSSFAWPSRI